MQWNNRGFTLTEVMIGITILIVGFVPVYLFLFSSEKSAVETTRTVEAMMRAQTLLDEITHLPYEALPVEYGRISALEFKSHLREEYSTRIAADMKEELEGFEKFVEVREGRNCKTVRVWLRDTTKATAKDGTPRELLLGTLVIP